MRERPPAINGRTASTKGDTPHDQSRKSPERRCQSDVRDTLSLWEHLPFRAAPLIQKRSNAVTAEQIHWIKIAEAKLGHIAKLGEVLEHWRKTGANINSISARDGVEEFLSWKVASNHLKPRTVSDSRSRLRNFGKYFGDTPFNQITAESLDRFLLTPKEGGDRRSYWKRIKPMFRYASTIKNWIAVNPLDKLGTPAWGTPKRGGLQP